MTYPTQKEQEQRTAAYRDRVRSIVRENTRGTFGPLALDEISELADSIDGAVAARHNDSEQPMWALTKVAPVLTFSAAERLRILGESLGEREAETIEQLAKAGEAASEAQQLAEQLRERVGQVTHAADILDAELLQAQGMLDCANTTIANLIDDGREVRIERNEARQIADEATAAMFELAGMLVAERGALQTAQRTIAHLLDELDEAEQPVEVVFQFAEAGEGVSVEHAADMALALVTSEEGKPASSM